MLLWMTLVRYFLWLSSIPLCICTTSPLPIHPSVDVRLLPCVGCYKQCCCEHWCVCSFLFSTLPNVCPGVVVFLGTSSLFYIVGAPTDIPINNIGGFPSQLWYLLISPSEQDQFPYTGKGMYNMFMVLPQRHLTLGIPTHGYNLVRLYLEMITIKMKLIHYTDYIMIIPHPGRRQSGNNESCYWSI